MSKTLVEFDNKKAFVGMYNARRPDKMLKFGAELAHFENQVLTSLDKELPGCTQISFQNTLLEAVSLGLTWNKRMGQCYPIRYGNSCTLSVGYQGLTHLVMKAGTLKSVQPVLVCKNDPVFDTWIDENGVHIKHKIARTERGPITHAYCIARYTNGGYHIEIMEWFELEKVRACAKTRMIWDKWLGPQCMKSVIRRAWKHWPKDDGGVIETAMDLMNKIEPVDFGPPDLVEEEPQYITITEDQDSSLHAMVNDHYEELNDPSPTTIADKWMGMLCQAMGITKLSQLPADRYDDAVLKIQQRLEKVDKHRSKRDE